MLEGFGLFLKFLDILEFLFFDKENIVRLVLDIFFFGLDNMIKDLEFVLGIVLFWIKNVDLKVIVYYLKIVLVCLLMLKVKWVLIYYGVICCEENMIEIVVFSMFIENIKEVRIKFYLYSVRFEYSRKYLVDSDLIYSFV